MDAIPPGDTLGSDAARHLRVQAQGLAQLATGTRPDAIIAALCGVQAQDMPGAALSLWARSADLHQPHLDQAIRERRVVRTWALRGTLHLLAAPDVRWVLAALAPALTKPSGRHTILGLDQQTFAQAMPILHAALRGGQQLTRAELGATLQAHGVAPDGQRLPYILGYASLHGLLCQGPPRGREPTYVLFDEWLPPGQPPDRTTALCRLARRYLAGYGPADVHDFAWWSGLPLSEARMTWNLIQPEIVAVTVAGKRHALLASAPDGRSTTSAPTSQPCVRLLPGFDSYLLGYRDRHLMLDPAYVKRVNAGGGMLKPTVLVDGRVVGVWCRRVRRHRMDVIVTPFERLVAGAAAAITAEVARLGSYLEQETELVMSEPA